MYLNIKELGKVNSGKIYISEIYPPVQGNIYVPTGRSGKVYKAFRSVKDAKPVSDKRTINRLLTKEEYYNFIQTLKSEMAKRGVDVKYNNNNITMYTKYKTACAKLPISGVMHITDLSGDVEVVTQYPLFNPTEAYYSRDKLSLESYWGIVMNVIPHIDADFSTIYGMWVAYCKSNQFDHSTIDGIDSKLMTETTSVRDVLYIVVDALTKVGLNPKSVQALVANNVDTYSSNEALLPYYSFMMNRYKIPQHISEAYLLYTVSSHIPTIYENIGFKYKYNTNGRIVVSVEKEETISSLKSSNGVGGAFGL